MFDKKIFEKDAIEAAALALFNYIQLVEGKEVELEDCRDEVSQYFKDIPSADEAEDDEEFYAVRDEQYKNWMFIAGKKNAEDFTKILNRDYTPLVVRGLLDKRNITDEDEVDAATEQFLDEYAAIDPTDDELEEACKEYGIPMNDKSRFLNV